MAPVLDTDRKKVVLVGNPNVGKSVFFNAWSGIYVDVSNFPGTTVDITAGRVGEDALYDTPGVYGVGSFNDEETVARDVILSSDVVVNIVDATHLERDLFLTLQLMDMEIPTVVALNFCDEAEMLGIEIDVEALGEALGVEVVKCAAVLGQGLDDVREAIGSARPGKPHPQVAKELGHLIDRVGTKPEALMVAEGDEAVSARHGVEPLELREEIYTLRRQQVNALTDRIVVRPDRGNHLRDIVGGLCLHPIWGVGVVAMVLWACYQLVGVVVAGDVVGFTEETVMQGYYEPWIKGVVTNWTEAESVLGQILIGEFGVLTMTVTYLLGLLLPLVTGFYIAMAILEDSGYLPRLATLADRMMTAMGLNGRAVIPVILGFGCVQLGTITTRILGSNRERTIATTVLNLVVPCSAQIGVIAGMLAALGGLYTLSYGLVILICLVAVGTVMDRVMPGKSTSLLIDLPPMRFPRPANVLRKTAVRSYFFMKEAYIWFFAGALGVSVLQITGGLDAWQSFMSPFTEGILRLPGEASTAFIMGMVRRDFGAAGLTALPLDPWQVVVSLVVITLFVPCIASLMILFKERGAKEATAIWVGSWIFAFSVGGVLARIVL